VVVHRKTRPSAAAPRAVVTGGAGFLGSHVCEELLARGWQVVCLDSFLTGRPANVAHLLDDARFRLLRRDLTVPLEVPVDVPGPVDLVLHLASPASPVDYLRLPIETLEVGSLGTSHALGLARDKGARFLLASTSEVYGDPQPETYWGHVNPIGPRGVYDEAKRYAEALTTAYRTAHGVDTTIVRIFNTYGPRMRPDDGRMIPTFVRQALGRLGERRVEAVGDGVEVRRRDPARLQAPAHRLLRQLPRRERHGPLGVLAAREPLLLGGGDDPAVDDEGGGRVVEDGVDPEDAHGVTLR
jgi:dTDP-glucose 4,6-dehydratase